MIIISWEVDFPQTCSFRRILYKDHKNFCFAPIPDKTNEFIFLKNPKSMFYGNFCPFLSFLIINYCSVIYNKIWTQSTFQEPKSDFSVLMKYWQLTNIEISLAEEFFFFFWHDLWTKFFADMPFLQNGKNSHKIIRSTPIPDKTNDLIFWKSSKACFWGIFDHF